MGKKDKTIKKVNGILFETLMPVRVIQIPQPGGQLPVQIGVRITNQSSTPYRFNLPGFFPKLLSSTGQFVCRDYASNARWRVQESDIPLLQSGEGVTFLTNANLKWRTNECLCLWGYANYGGVWRFDNLAAGEYRIQFEYKGPSQAVELLMQVGGRRQLVDQFWPNEVSTTFLAFSFV
jgi:hypothetical protein